MSKLEERNLSFESCKLIEVYREQKKMSRVMLAKMVGVSYSYVFKIETGRKRGVTYKILQSIADVLKIDLHVLVGEERTVESESIRSFENIFFNQKICIEGQELGLEQKLNVYKILKTLVNQDLSKSKKLEHIISDLFDKKEVSASI